MAGKPVPLVPLSGVRAWIALACLGAAVLGAMRPESRMTRLIRANARPS
jgi:hypothetical protein